MSILELPPPPHVPTAESEPRSDRLRVITAGSVGSMDARLGASGFDIVAVAETEHELIDAVSADEPDAIVVEADLCESLEHVRDLAPDAVLIVVGDHTPDGALGHIDRGVSGAVMAGLLHALVAEGIGGAIVWGLVPALGQGGGLPVIQRVGGSLLEGKADFIRAHLLNTVNAFRDHAELIAATSTVAVTVTASVVLTMSAPRTDERPVRVPLSAPVAERVAQEPAPQHPIFAISPTRPRPTPGSSGNEIVPGDKQKPNRGNFPNQGRPDGPGENGHVQGENGGDQVVGEGSDDQLVNESNDDQVVNDRNDPHGQADDPHGQADDPHGQSEDTHGKNEGHEDHGINPNKDDKGKNEDGETDQGDDQGNNEGTESEVDDDQGENESEDGQDEGNDYQGEDTSDQGETSDLPIPF